MKNIIILITASLILTGCTSSETKKEWLKEKAKPCLQANNYLPLALSCLREKDYKNWVKHNNTYSSRNCMPHWGYPFTAMCTDIIIKYEGDKILSYKLWSKDD